MQAARKSEKAEAASKRTKIYELVHRPLQKPSKK